MIYSDLTLEQLEGFRDFLLTLLTEQRKQRLLDHIRYRTRHLTVVIENLYQPHNASAVIRSCDCFGIQDLHIIENKNPYRVNPNIVLGSNRWINIEKHPNGPLTTKHCLDGLKMYGYKIVATTPHIDSYTPENLPLDDKIALVLGAELEGISQEVNNNADYFLRIPMVGFTESLNVSVSAAICLYTLSNRLRSSAINWQLSPREQALTLIQWAKTNLNKPDIIERTFFGSNDKD